MKIVLSSVCVTFCGPFMIVERDARRNHINECKALMFEGRFNDGDQLLLLSGKAASHEGNPERKGKHDGIDRRYTIGLPALAFRSHIGGCGELSFGQSIDAVVFDNIDNI